MTNRQFGVISETETCYYTLSPDSGIALSSETDAKVPCFISDTLLDVKTITVPVVAKSMLPSIIFNTIKKHSAAKPDSTRIDYTIMKKHGTEYTALVFVYTRQIDETITTTKTYGFYALIQALIQTGEFDTNADFIIKEGKTWFYYTFNEGMFVKRDIYFAKDLKNLDCQTIHYISLDPNDNHSSSFLPIPPKTFARALSSLKKPLFRKKQEIKPHHLVLTGIAVILILLSIILQIQYTSITDEKDLLVHSKNRLSKQLATIREDRGMTDEMYTAYSQILEKRSDVDLFFSALHTVGIENIQIDSVSYAEGSFSITGICRDDSKLEQDFRISPFWNDVHFSFTRKKKKIIFRISGGFNAF